jgi:DNA-binding NarL/FixJ family response regulator
MPMTLGHTATGPGDTSVRVLLIEDSTLIRARLKNMLEQIQGVEIVGYADDVVEAEEAFTRLHPNVVTLDLELPTGSGITVLQYIRRVSRETLVIVLTNHAHPHYRKKCLSEGANYFLDKSAEFEEVVNILKQTFHQPTVR